MCMNTERETRSESWSTWDWIESGPCNFSSLTSAFRYEETISCRAPFLVSVCKSKVRNPRRCFPAWTPWSCSSREPEIWLWCNNAWLAIWWSRDLQTYLRVCLVAVPNWSSSIQVNFITIPSSNRGKNCPESSRNTVWSSVFRKLDGTMVRASIIKHLTMKENSIQNMIKPSSPWTYRSYLPQICQERETRKACTGCIRVCDAQSQDLER